MSFRELLGYGRILQEAARLIAHPLSAADCMNLVRDRMRARGPSFLAIVDEKIYRNPRSPYLQLLRHVGCEQGDIERMVREQGVEGALEALRDSGVYLTFEEFKGRTNVVRGSGTFQFSEADFDNPCLAPAVPMRTGGSRSAGSLVNVSLRYVAEQRAPARRLIVEALAPASTPVILWLFSRRAVGLLWWLSLSHTGRPPYRWFYIADPASDQTTLGHLGMFRIGQIVGGMRGARLPYPEHAPFARAELVLDVVLQARTRSGACILVTSPSAAVRLAALAGQRGVTLEGVVIVGDAEPLTPAKAQEIRKSGAFVGSSYAFREAGSVGAPCAQPEAADDMHLLEQDFAMIVRRRSVAAAGEIGAFMFTSLVGSASKILLNVESDDFGEITERRCGCLWDTLGLHRHLAYVRSFTKLTGEGMTVLGTDTVAILEEVLPKEFGGTSVDYQLIEAEDEHHLTRIFLIISPSLGPVDEQRVMERFRHELRKGVGHSFLWAQAGTLRVVRRDPVVTPGGKILPFHTQATAGTISRPSHPDAGSAAH